MKDMSLGIVMILLAPQDEQSLQGKLMDGTGVADGLTDGESVESTDGLDVGITDGLTEGEGVRTTDGLNVGLADGLATCDEGMG
jgi:hypothetical protein